MKGKGWALLLTAAAVTMGMTLTSFAAEGWARSNDKWVYFNSSGDLVSDDWRKGADGQAEENRFEEELRRRNKKKKQRKIRF